MNTEFGVTNKWQMGKLEWLSGLVSLSDDQQMELNALRSMSLLSQHQAGVDLGLELVYLRTEIIGDGGGSQIAFTLSVDFADVEEVGRFSPFVPRMMGAARLLKQPGAEFHFDKFEAEMKRKVKGGSTNES